MLSRSRTNPPPLMYSVDEVKQRECNVLIVGSGPAATAAAEQLYESSNATIVMVERGDLVTTTHLANVLSFKQRRSFVDLYGQAWDGDYEGGRLISGVGGRGIAAGGLLRRLDPEDLTSPGTEWPGDVAEELAHYYEVAEERRRVGIGVYPGPLQGQVLGRLQKRRAYTPPLGFDFTLGKTSYLHDSSVARLWKLNLKDSLEKDSKRLLIVPNTVARRFVVKSGGVKSVECYSRRSKQTVSLSARVVVCAASAIESARLALYSNIEPRAKATGKYLADHITSRQDFVVDPWSAGAEGEFEVLVPPAGASSDERFQVQIFGGIREGKKLHFTMVGFAAMDACEDSRVELSEKMDESGVPVAKVTATPTGGDETRKKRMIDCMAEIAVAMGGATSVRAVSEPLGAGYHEAGTLRMSSDPDRSVTNSCGRFRAVDNLYVADASVFPSVGVANPMLTVTALAYRQADKIIHRFGL